MKGSCGPKIFKTDRRLRALLERQLFLFILSLQFRHPISGFAIMAVGAMNMIFYIVALCIVVSSIHDDDGDCDSDGA